MGLHQSKKLLYNKGNNYQNKRTAYRMAENLCYLFIGEYPEYIKRFKN
jgi:hypothetical protein